MLKIKLPTRIKRLWQSIALPMLKPTQSKQMRDFSWQFSLLLIIVFMGVLPWLFSGTIPLWPLFITGYLLLSALVFPKGVYPIYVIWMVIASILGFINTQILLALVFYVVFTPIGFILRLTNGLQYQHRCSPTLKSYYIKRDKPLNKDHLTKPF